jgi:hypothetical protein
MLIIGKCTILQWNRRWKPTVKEAPSQAWILFLFVKNAEMHVRWGYPIAMITQDVNIMHATAKMVLISFELGVIKFIPNLSTHGNNLEDMKMICEI